MALTVSEAAYLEARSLADQGLIAEAWAALAAGGDTYAGQAQLIIAEWRDPQSAVSLIVNVNWERTVGADVQAEKFETVGLKHLNNYLDYVYDNGYQLPDTEFIERSYKDALAYNDLPAVTAIDSLFSLLDYQIEQGLAPSWWPDDALQDFSWAWMLNLEPERIKYDVDVFANETFDPVAELWEVSSALVDKFFSFELSYQQLSESWSMMTGVLGDVASEAVVANMLGRAYTAEEASAAYGFINAIDASYEWEQALELVDAASNTTGTDLPTLVHQIDVLVRGDAAAPMPTDLETAMTVGRDVANVLNQTGEQYTLVNAGLLSPQELAQLAGEDSTRGLAYRHTLVSLSPVVLEGADSLYLQQNADGHLNVENFSESYLNDRAFFLSVLSYMNGENISQVPSLYGEAYFEDRASGTTVSEPLGRFFIFGSDADETITGDVNQDQLYGGGGADVIAGGAGDDYIEGNAGGDDLDGGEDNDVLLGGSGNDALQGGAGEDVLFGGSENDTLRGGAGRDYLLGGAGTDEYRYNSGDGPDTIIDADGAGAIYYDGILLTGGKRIGGDEEAAIYVSDDGVFEYHYLQRTDTITIYRVDGQGMDGDALTITNVSGFLAADSIPDGFTLAEASAPTGTLDSFLATTYDGNVEWASLGINVAGYGLTFGESEPEPISSIFWGTDQGDHLVGSESNDEMYGLDGNDYLRGYYGDDLIVGGAGDDTLQGEEGDDVLSGEAGRDILLGDYAGDPVGGRDHLDGGTEQDALGGGLKSDTVLGGDGDDLISGGEGSDIVEGGTGNDLIFGDGSWSQIDVDWSLTMTLNPDNTISLATTGIYDLSEVGGAGDAGDIISGGEGFDGIFGGAGDDIISGDDGNDTLSGGAGSDIIYGGTGDDRLYGGNSASTLLEGDKDRLYGGAGNDLIMGGIDDDFASGGTENDIILGGDGDDTLHGDEGNDELQGEAGNDSLYGGIGDDALLGGIGDDWLDGGDGIDHLEGGEGNDQMYGGTGADELQANEGNDTLYGGDDDDLMFGHDGDDALYGELGNDQLVGGIGNDTIDGGDGNDYAWGEAGVDVLSGGAGMDELDGGIDDDVLRGGTEDDRLWGQDGNDQLYGDEGNDYLDGGLGDDTLVGGLGDDELWGGEGVDLLDGGDGADYIEAQGGDDTVLGGEGDDQIYGGLGNDTLQGDAGNDLILGEDGDDTLRGGAGNDQLEGGTGTDTYVFVPGDGHDVIIESSDAALDVLQLGSGVDDVLIARRGDDLLLSHSNGTDSITVKYWFASEAYRLQQVEFSDGTVLSADALTTQALTYLVGTDGDDSIGGTSASETLVGYAGNDTISGIGGNDTFIGGAGNDTISGAYGSSLYLFGLGDGWDTISEYSYYTDLDTLVFGAGISPSDVSYERIGSDLVIGHVNGVDGVTVKNWYVGDSYQIEEIRFEDYPADTLTGAQVTEIGVNVASNYSFAIGDGNIAVADWGGVDTLALGEGITTENLRTQRIGNDLVFTVFGATDSLTVSGWFEGPERQVETIAFADGQTWTSETLTDQHLALVGTVGDDTLNGSDYYGEVLEGLEGNDTLNAFGGNDTLVGGAGNDVLSAGDGNDTLNGGSGDDSLYGGYGHDLYTFNAGDGVDYISDSSGSNVVRFGSGLSYLDHVYTDSGTSRTITFIGSSEQVTISGYSSTWDDATWSLQYVQEGTEGDDTIDGYECDDVLYGYAGNDVINGGAGYDRLYGGDHDDILTGEMLYGEGGNDTLKDCYYGYGGAGNDTIYANDDGSGYGATLYGDDGNDIIIGHLASDKLYGGAGDDVIGGEAGSQDSQNYNRGNTYEGGTGDDLLRGTSGDDVYVFNMGDGNDIIEEYYYFYLYENRWSDRDLLKLGEGITVDSVSATRSENDLVFNISPTDSITVRDWFTSVYYQLDTVRFSDGSELTRDDMTRLALTQHGTEGADTLHGVSTWGDALYGHGGDDMLYGYSGNDVLDGGSGRDQLEGGAGDDTYVFNLGNGDDTIIDREGWNRVTFGAGISAADVSYGRIGNDLVLSVGGTSDRLIVTDFLVDEAVRQLDFAFEDGSQLMPNSQIADNLINVQGTSLNDTLIGSAGFDRIYGYEGDDVLSGLGDNDELYGGLGNDIYVAASDSARVVDEGGVTTLRYDDKALNELTMSIEWTLAGHNLNIDGFSVEDGLNVVSSVQATDGTVTLEQLLESYATNFGYISHTYEYPYPDYISVMEGTLFNDWMVGDRVLEMNGNEGDDYLKAEGYSSTSLNGGDGNDILDGNSASNTLTGGAGDDTLRGASGNDTYLFGLGDGADTVVESYGTDELTLTNIARADADIYLSGDDLVVEMKETGESVTVQGWDSSIYYQLEQAVFADGVILSNADLNAADVRGTGGTLRGSKNADRVFGGDADEYLLAKDSDDSLDGGAGNDTLEGGNGNDDYLFSTGWGQDTIIEKDGSAYTDMAAFGTGIGAQDLKFERIENDLIVTCIGTTDAITVQDWYLDTANHVEEFRVADGSTLSDTSVEQLIQAMASFQQSQGGISWEDAVVNYRDETNAILTSHWQ